MGHSRPDEEAWPSEVYVDRLLAEGNAECTRCGRYGLLRAVTPNRIGCLGCGLCATLRDGVVTWDDS